MKSITLGRGLMALVISGVALVACVGEPDPQPESTTAAALEPPKGGGSGGGMCDITQHSDGTWWQNGYCSSWRPVGSGNSCPGTENLAQCPIVKAAHEYYDNICGLHQNPNAPCSY